MNMIKLIILGMVLGLASFAVLAIEPEEIITQMEQNQTHATSQITGTMIITDRFGSRESTFISWNRGTEESLLEFTSPAERGQRVLRTADEIYLYYPDAAELIRLQGTALRDSLVGSDVSYEDMTGNRGFLANYHVELEETEELGDTTTYRLLLTARSSNVAYPLQRMWIDTTDFVVLQSEQYSLSGKLLKRSITEKTIRQAGKIFPVEVLIEDQLKRNSSTRMLFTTIEVDIPIPDSQFSLESLSF